MATTQSTAFDTTKSYSTDEYLDSTGVGVQAEGLVACCAAIASTPIELYLEIAVLGDIAVPLGAV